MALEVSIERYLKGAVEKSGGMCIKLNPTGLRGIPDRLVILPGPWLVFTEVKRPKGGVVGRLQIWWKDRLERLGCEHRFILNRDDVDALIGDYRERTAFNKS
jgi:hypothetical protein